MNIHIIIIVRIIFVYSVLGSLGPFHLKLVWIRLRTRLKVIVIRTWTRNSSLHWHLSVIHWFYSDIQTVAYWFICLLRRLTNSIPVTLTLVTVILKTVKSANPNNFLVNNVHRMFTVNMRCKVLSRCKIFLSIRFTIQLSMRRKILKRTKILTRTIC